MAILPKTPVAKGCIHNHEREIVYPVRMEPGQDLMLFCPFGCETLLVPLTADDYETKDRNEVSEVDTDE